MSRKEFIEGLRDKLLEETTMTEYEAYNFAFTLYNVKDVVNEYLDGVNGLEMIDHMIEDMNKLEEWWKRRDSVVIV